jgi:RNA polymerase sigma-70 factor (ECF subfamily)
MDELLERLKNQNEDALKEIMAMYKRPICRYLNALTGSRELAEELAQDTFVKVYFKAPGLKATDLKSCRAWIYAIASNLARSEFRRRKLRKIFSLTDVGERQASFTPSYEGDIIWDQLLNLLPDKFRIPLVMKEIDNFSFEEIAEILKKPVGTVKSLVFRGKGHMKKMYRPGEGEGHA